MNSSHTRGELPEKGIYTDFLNRMTYGEYLGLDSLLSSQHPLSGHHDEMLFIIIHQTSELWMKLIIHELKAAMDCIHRGELSMSFKMLARVSRIQEQIIRSWDVLSTLTPAEYMEFRDKLGQASGFQSWQYRMIEFYLGNKSHHIMEIYKKDPELLEKIREALESPSLYDISIQQLAKAGLPVDPGVLDRDWTQPYQPHPSVEEAWMTVYKNVDKYWDLYQLAEKLIDLEDWLQQWRFRHLKTVERVIGFKRGTGGSSGVPYLKGVLDQRFFPELWDLRTRL
ncbi:tryptophan 2,3-dioxygenase [Staphylospora marina]|uniref:tryptophan 2,3-dioxygenase n=1 Tax=Staphylospora marina TaxID=2490858 RepID=UPI000F5BACEE|nr:tryptophan 2,3-dioxygenase [Staphylospora marina]